MSPPIEDHNSEITSGGQDSSYLPERRCLPLPVNEPSFPPVECRPAEEDGARIGSTALAKRIIPHWDKGELVGDRESKQKIARSVHGQPLGLTALCSDRDSVTDANCIVVRTSY